MNTDDFIVLDDFITAVTSEIKVHVCIEDVSGITKYDLFKINASRKIHSSRFCESAKALNGGLRLCMKCKTMANNKAIDTKKVFSGICPFGVTEIAYPVISNVRVLCIVYVGMMSDNLKKTEEKIIKTCKLLKSPYKNVIKSMKYIQYCENTDKYFNLAKIIGEYIALMYNTCDIFSQQAKYHSVVEAAVEYAEKYYYKDIRIDNIADIYGINKKYLGRLFKEQTGESFNTYLNIIRVNHAKQLISGTKASIIEIALECGFNNVTYFNRVFKNLENITPTHYRKFGE